MKCSKYAKLVVLLFLNSLLLLFIKSNAGFTGTRYGIITHSLFLDALRSLDWNTLKEGRIDDLITILRSYIVMSPLVAINNSCRPLILPLPSCSHYPQVFSGLHSKPVKIGHIIQLGNDIDVLEIALNEMDEYVDRFFILESTISHSDFSKKPLMFEAVKTQKRFSKFTERIVHIILDDVDIATNVDDGGIWSVEHYQEKARWDKFLSWNSKKNFFDVDDMIGFGDSDEIPSRQALNFLKHCQPQSDVVSIDVGITYFEGNLNRIIETDFPVPGHPYALGDPTFYSLSSAKNASNPNRQRGRSERFILGGAHLTWYNYFPYELLKRIMCTECKSVNIDIRKSDFEKLEMLIQSEGDFFSNISTWHYVSKTPANFDSVSSSIMPHYHIPWFLECNKNRYPSFYGYVDTRISPGHEPGLVAS